MNNKHTPLPWTAQRLEGPGHWQILAHPDCRQILIARQWPDKHGVNTPESLAETEANADLVVRAVNNHEDLVGIAKAYRNLLRTMAHTEGEVRTFQHIQDVLAKVGGTE